MLDRPSVVRLREGLAELTQAAVAQAARDDDLRERVCAVVEDLRALEWPPERVIIAVKQVAEDAGLRSSRRVLMVSGSLTPNDEVVQNLVRWCIEHYYRTAPRL